MLEYPRLVAHRGGGTLAPENTLAALRCGVQRGYRAVEFDAMLSRDGIPVLMHDVELGRTVPGRGPVAALSAAELAGLDAGSWFGPAFAGEPVPTLEQAILFCKERGIWMNIEVKPGPGAERATGRAVASLVHHHFRDAVSACGGNLPVLSSFSQEALVEAQQVAKALPRALLVKSVPVDWHVRLQELDATGLHVDHRYLSARRVQAVQEEGYRMLCYTVNSPSRMRELLGWGVDAVCTDRLDLLPPQLSNA